jgi:hypothetical protein
MPEYLASLTLLLSSDFHICHYLACKYDVFLL